MYWKIFRADTNIMNLANNLVRKLFYGQIDFYFLTSKQLGSEIHMVIKLCSSAIIPQSMGAFRRVLNSSMFNHRW
jgi:hypothetical protein